MEERVRRDILEVLIGAVRAARREDARALKSLSDRTIHNASIHQDQYSLSVSVLMYALAKLYGRERYVQFKLWVRFCDTCADLLGLAVKKLEDRDDAGFEEVLKNILRHLTRTEKKLREYVKDVFQKAKVSKASRLHEHGISLGRTADLLGVSEFELMEYVGKTYIADMPEGVTLSGRERLKIARKLFR